jgi:hypothetical protein
MDHGQGAVRRSLRRTLHQSHGGLMFKPPPHTKFLTGPFAVLFGERFTRAMAA